MADAQRTRLVLDVLHGLLMVGPSRLPRLPELLGELVRAFDATAAGVSGLLTEAPRVEQRVSRDGPAPQLDLRPWAERSELTNRLRQDGVAETVGTNSTSLLLALIPASEGNERILWLEAPPSRAWTDPEKAALTLAARVIDRVLPTDKGPSRRDQTQLEARLRDAALISGRAAHAFDNVLTGILGFAELTLQMVSDATLQQYLGEVLQAAQNGTQLTQQLHLFHRCAVLSSGPTRLAAVVMDEEMRLRQTLPPQVELTVEVPNDLPAVGLDGEPLRQVLAQLLNNAHESLAGPGRITLSAQAMELNAATCASLYGNPRPGPCVVLTVADSGTGLSADARQRLFHEPFFTTKPRHRGLGLAVVYRILHAHHAGFQLEPAPEHGMRALVYLPLATATAPTGTRLLSALST